MAWTDQYIDLQFKPNGRDRDGLDCWGLVHLVYKDQLGIDLPLYDGIFRDETISSLKNVARIMTQERDTWQKVDKPEPFDVVMLRTGKYTWHVGIVVDRVNMLHIMSGIESVVEPYRGLMWKNRIEEFRHYVR